MLICLVYWLTHVLFYASFLYLFQSLLVTTNNTKASKIRLVRYSCVMLPTLTSQQLRILSLGMQKGLFKSLCILQKDSAFKISNAFLRQSSIRRVNRGRGTVFTKRSTAFFFNSMSAIYIKVKVNSTLFHSFFSQRFLFFCVLLCRLCQGNLE